MKIDTNRVSAYLAGNFPPYYESFPKIEFILKLSEKAGKVFPGDRFDLIEKHTNSLQQFFSESLNLIKNHEDLLVEIIEDLQVPLDARGPDFVQTKIKQKEILKENEGTIGFITPFDKEEEYLEFKLFIEKILSELEGQYGKWIIKVSDFDIGGEKNILWESVEEFLNKYPFYIANFRNQNLNVPLEVGFLLGKNINFIPIIEEGEKISDLDGFIKVSSKDSVSKPWVDNKKAKTIHSDNKDKFKDKIKEQLERYIKNH